MSQWRLVAGVATGYGRTYAEEAGITLVDRPGAMYQLLVLTTLLSKPISPTLAIGAARELFNAGYVTPQAMVAAGRRGRVAALGRGHYRRFDESASTILEKAAVYCDEMWRGDLRRARHEADAQVTRLCHILIGIPGIGAAGANIFVREVQGVWPEFQPFVDVKALSGARLLGLPESPTALAALIEPDRFPRLAAGLVRIALNRAVPDELRPLVRAPASG